jgi:hypothetical protein
MSKASHGLSSQSSMMAEMLSIPGAFYAMDGRLVVDACAMHN